MNNFGSLNNLDFAKEDSDIATITEIIEPLTMNKSAPIIRPLKVKFVVSPYGRIKFIRIAMINVCLIA